VHENSHGGRILRRRGVSRRGLRLGGEPNNRLADEEITGDNIQNQTPLRKSLATPEENPNLQASGKRGGRGARGKVGEECIRFLFREGRDRDGAWRKKIKILTSEGEKKTSGRLLT